VNGGVGRGGSSEEGRGGQGGGEGVIVSGRVFWGRGEDRRMQGGRAERPTQGWARSLRKHGRHRHFGGL